MSRIKHRTSPELLGVESLLPSQRALLEITTPQPNWSTLHKLSVEGNNQLGVLLKEHLTPLAVEAIDNPHSYSSQRLMRTMAVMATQLIQSDNPSAFSEFVSVEVRDGYEDFDEHSEYTGYESSGCTFFTPQGFVRNPSDTFTQKVIALEMKTPKLPEGENKLSLHLYTDNTEIATPAWELTDDQHWSDVFPSPGPRTYDLHKAPDRFPTEAVAFSVASSLARIIKLSDESA